MTVTIYSTRRGLLSSAIAPLLLTLLGLWAVATAGFRIIPVVALVSGSSLLSIALLDYPRQTRFGEKGIERINYLRRHYIKWDAVNALERVPISYRTSGRRPTAGERASSRAPSTGAGLVARVGKRRYLLVNTVESRAEFEDLTSVIEAFAPHVSINAAIPSETTVPTDLYRRKRQAG
jgi:hypothetical protein